ncbi:hypothetical protein [Flavobacterium sp.]
MITKDKEAQYKQTINELFPNLFVIEEIENNQFSIYEVVWEKTQ